MVRIHLHPVWETALTDSEKERYENAAKSVASQPGKCSTAVIEAKYKKNGGFVAKLFLINGFDDSLHIEKIHVSVKNASDESIAKGSFVPNLEIEAHCAQPWSFVFSKEMVIHPNASLDDVTIDISID